MTRRMTQKSRIIAIWLMLSCQLAVADSSSVLPYEQVVDAFTSEFQQAVRDYDADRWSSLMAEDVVMMSPSGRMLEGRETFRSFWSRVFEGQSGANPLTIRIDDIRASEDVIAVRAHYGPEGQDTVGQYVWILSRQADGVWRLDWWIFNRIPSPASS